VQFPILSPGGSGEEGQCAVPHSPTRGHWGGGGAVTELYLVPWTDGLYRYCVGLYCNRSRLSKSDFFVAKKFLLKIFGPKYLPTITI